MLYGLELTNSRLIAIANFDYHKFPEYHLSRVMDVHDMFYVIDGFFSVRLEDEEIDLYPGDIAFLPADHPHYGCHLGRADTHTIYFHFTKTQGDHVLSEKTDSDMAEGSDNLLVLPSKMQAVNQMVRQYFDDLARIWSSHSLPFYDMRCSAILNLLLFELYDCYSMHKKLHDPAIMDLLSFILAHPHRFFSIDELAEKAKISLKSLSIRFKKETGQAVHQYQMNYKLDLVAALLRKEYFLSLKNLAANYGFCDEFHLSSSFKKKFGISPKNYVNGLSMNTGTSEN